MTVLLIAGALKYVFYSIPQKINKEDINYRGEGEKRRIDNHKFLRYNFIVQRGKINMNFYLTDQPKRKLNSVQFIPMKHCAEYSE